MSRARPGLDARLDQGRPYVLTAFRAVIGLLPIQNGGEAAVFFCWTLLLLTFAGPGALFLDHYLTPAAARPATTSAAEKGVPHIGVRA